MRNELLELSLRQTLSAEEQARAQAILDQNPVLRQAWEQDRQLSQLLERLPNRPISSNFTALVLQAVEQSKPIEARWALSRLVIPLIHWRWLRPAAVATIVICASSAGYHHHLRQTRWEMARSLVAVSALAEIAHPNLVKDFDLLEQFSGGRFESSRHLVSAEANPVDMALLADLQP